MSSPISVSEIRQSLQDNDASELASRLGCCDISLKEDFAYQHRDYLHLFSDSQAVKLLRAMMKNELGSFQAKSTLLVFEKLP